MGDVDGDESKRQQLKPVIGARMSLWGNAPSGTMVGVSGLVRQMQALLKQGNITTSSLSPDGYSLFPVHAWSHTYADVVEAARLLQATNDFEVITPSQLLADVVANVVTPSS